MPATSSTAIATLILSAIRLYSAGLASRFSSVPWQAKRESNPQPSVLETDALPVELLACVPPSLNNLRDDARADGLAALADGKPQALLHRNRRNQAHYHLHVVPRHHHLGPRGQLAAARHVRGPKVELRPVPREERRVPPALLLREHVHLALELGVRGDRGRFGQHLPALHLFPLGAPQEHPDVVPRLPLVPELPEHHP